ncbi:MAG: TonB-dependent receptor domain-containing protein [Bryobacteraceae bacterium]
MKLHARFLLFLCLPAAALLCQTPTGQITGLVADPSGAVVAKADLDIANADTGIHWKAATNESGYYTVPLLPPGRYSITVRVPGFKTVTRANITLVVAEIDRIDFQLQVGQTNETVEVTAAPPLLESETAALGQVVQTRAINDLPLNGRNYLELAKLTAGVSEAQGSDVGAPGGSFVANGVRAQLNNFNLDGADNNTRIVDIQNQDYEVIRPSVDALEEFKVETSNYSSEYGYSAGAVVNATLKSGTNRYHGAAFEFLRNDHLDARDYFLPSAAVKQRHQRNQFGGVFGGPIRKDKTFFFGSWENTQENLGLTMTTTVPTAAFLSGNLLGAKPIFDPGSTRVNPNGSGYVRTPFPGNLIPASQISPVSAKVNELMPAPNVGGATVNNYISNPLQTTGANRVDTKGDENLSSRDKLFVRYDYVTQLFVNPGPLPPPLVGSTSNNQNAHATHALSSALGETHIAGPSLVNEFRAGYSRINDVRGDLAGSSFLGPQYGFLGIPANPGQGIAGLPQMTISGFTNLGEPSYVPNGKLAEVLQFRDGLSWIKGNHSLRFGGEFEWIRSYYNVSSAARGTFSFDGTFSQDPQNRAASGNGFADYLLGYAANASIAQPSIGDARTYYTGYFIQDDWKVTPRLTLNLGLRYELWTWRKERNNLQGSFDPALGKIIYPENRTPAGIPASLVAPIPSGLGSRTLLPLDTNNFSPRIGLAWQLASHMVLRAGAGLFFASQAFPGAGATPLGSPPYLLTSTYPTDQLNPNVTFASGFPAGALQLQNLNAASAQWAGFDPGMKEPYVWKWNFGLQREIARFLLEANYVGTKGTQLPVFYDLNMPVPGGGSVASRRVYPAFGTIQYTQSLGNSMYESLETRVERQYANGISLLVNYTYGKSIDDGGVQLGGGDVLYRDVRNIMAERALSSFDMRQRLVFSFLYDLPFGRGRAFAISNPVLNSVLGNWQINGIATIRSGQPFTPELGFSTANTGDPRPNRIADGNLPADQRTIQRWFDTSAFTAATQYNFGNAGRGILIGPGGANFDFSTFKRVPVRVLGEGGEVQFRSEFFNLLNHPQFGNPSNRVDLQQGGTITSARPMRQIQFGLKVIF